MARARAQAERLVGASPAEVYEVLADYRAHHPRIMPPETFSDLEIEEGGVGEGTVFHITARVLGRKQVLHMRVAEPEPGTLLTETDLDSGVVTEFRVEPVGAGARVRMSTQWEANGIGGWLDRLLKTRLLRRLFASQLEQLATYMASKEVRS